MEEQTGFRTMLTPELILLVLVLVVAMGLTWRTSSGACHRWKTELSHITGGFLAAAGEAEFPAPGVKDQDQENIQRATKRVLDSRPFGCF